MHLRGFANSSKVTSSNRMTSQFKQCMVNRNYSQKIGGEPAKGGVVTYTDSNKRFFIHEHISNQKENNLFQERWGPCYHVSHWPHFSLQPSLCKTDIHEQLAFKCNTKYFEFEFSKEYFDLGWKTAFLEGTSMEFEGNMVSMGYKTHISFIFSFP